MLGGVFGDALLEFIECDGHTQQIRLGDVGIGTEGAVGFHEFFVPRAALDELASDIDHFQVKPAWLAELGKVAEGSQVTLGAYNRPWR